MARDEEYLEGMREADRQKSLSEALVSSSSSEEGLDNWNHTLNNWAAITPSSRAPINDLEYHQVPHEGDFLPGMNSREMHPVTQRNENVGTQLIEHVNRLSSMSERRPPKDYRVIARPGLTTSDETKLSLYHMPSKTAVGDVAWDNKTGHVNWLGVDYGHRHMTNYLVTQAWNHARTRGELGPASSGELSPFSEKLMAKYNPDSADYRRRQALDPNTTECPSCEGGGLEVMRPVSLDKGRTIQYHYSDGSGRVNIPEAPNTAAGREMGISMALSAEPGARTMGHFDSSNAFLHPESGSSHYWPDISHFCRNCGGTGRKLIHE